jgi:hypothetical protein
VVLLSASLRSLVDVAGGLALRSRALRYSRGSVTGDAGSSATCAWSG